MQAFLINLLECTVSMSVISLIYMILLPFLSKRYTAKWLYYGWLVIITGWIFPFRPQLDANIFPAKNPVIQNIRTLSIEYIDIGEPAALISNETGAASFISIWWVLASIWIIGVIISIIYHSRRHWRFMKLANRWGEDIIDLQILHVLNNLRAEMGINTKVGLKTCSSMTNPILAGFLRPVIFLPSVNLSANELTFILKHELIHLKKNDLWYKALVLLTTTIHWFNPLVYIVARAIAVQCEISCDELVLQGTSSEDRRQYGETIIAFVRKETNPQTTLSTNFYGGKKGMKTRIFSIMDTSKKRAGIIILCTVFMAIITTGLVFTTDPIKKNDSANVAIIKQTQTPVMGPVETKVLDVPEISKSELSESELSESELSESELSESELSESELSESELSESELSETELLEPELSESELSEPERAVKYYKDDIEIIHMVNGTEYIDIDWLSRYLINKFNSEYSLRVVGDTADRIKTQLHNGKTHTVLYDDIPIFSFVFNDNQLNGIPYDLFINELLPLLTD